MVAPRTPLVMLLAALPPEGRTAYELQFGAQARALLGEALTQEDDRKLGDVIRRFFHTRAGYEACLLAGRSELAQGRPLAAALHLQRLADAPAAAAAFDPELSLLLATCWWYARAPEQAQTVLIGLKSRLPRASLRLGGREVAVFADDSQALAWLEELVGPAGGLAVPEASQWVMYSRLPVAAALSVAFTVNVAVPPTGRSTVVARLPLPAAAQVAPPAAVQVQLTPLRVTGRVSVTVAPVTASGPALPATMV